MIRTITVYKPTKRGAEAIRSALRAAGVKANVRFFATSYRIALPVLSESAKAAVRDHLVLNDFVLSGSCEAATNREAYERAWTPYQGRGQIFVVACKPIP